MQCTVCGCWQHIKCVIAHGGLRSPFACDLCSGVPWEPTPPRPTPASLATSIGHLNDIELPTTWVLEVDGSNFFVYRQADVFSGRSHPRCITTIPQLLWALGVSVCLKGHPRRARCW